MRFPKYHTVDRLVADEQGRIKQKDSQTRARNQNLKVIQRKKRVSKQKLSKLPVVSDQQDPDLTPPSHSTPVKMSGNRDEERNHYWSLRDIPKFEGKR